MTSFDCQFCFWLHWKICIFSNIAAIRKKNNRTIHRWSKEMKRIRTISICLCFCPFYFSDSMFLCVYVISNWKIHSRVWQAKYTLFSLLSIFTFCVNFGIESASRREKTYIEIENNDLLMCFHSVHSISSTLTNKDKRVQGLDCDTQKLTPSSE